MVPQGGHIASCRVGVVVGGCGHDCRGVGGSVGPVGWLEHGGVWRIM